MFHLIPASLRHRLGQPGAPTPPASCWWVQPFDLAMADAQGQAAIAVGMGGFFSGLGQDTNIRILAVSEPYSPDEALAYVERRRAQIDPAVDWHYVGLGGYIVGLRHLLNDSDLHDVSYYVLGYPGRRVPPAALGNSAAANFGTPVVPCDLPPLFGNYVDMGGYLAPRDGQGPLMAIYTAYELIGSWQPGTIHRVMQLPFPTMLALDIENAGTKAPRQLETAYNTLSNQLATQLKIGAADPRTEASLADVIRAQHALEEDQTLHHVGVILAIQAPDLETLAQYRAELEGELATTMKLRPEPGQGAEWLKWFSPTPRRQIKARPAALPALSAGVGLLMPFGFTTGQGTDGLLLGFDQISRSPVIYDLWGQAERKGAHGLVLGKIGAGKTVVLESVAWRAATVLNSQVFVFDVLNNFSGLPYLLGGGACIYRLKLGGTALNILHRVFPGAKDLPKQINHARKMIGLALNSGERDESDEAERRTFDPAERAVLNRALTLLYKPTWDDPAAPSPLLGGLCHILATMPGIGEALAAEIYDLFVDPESEMSAVFNRPTNIDMTFPRQAYIFDVSELDEGYAEVFYAQFIAMLDYYLRFGDRDRNALVIMDEFKRVARNPFVARMAVNMTKIGRNFKVGVWTSDQDISSYFLTPQASQILANLAVVMIGRQEGQDVEDVRATFHQLNDTHQRRLLKAATGEFMVRVDDEYHWLTYRLTELERIMFTGDRQARRQRALPQPRSLDAPTALLRRPAHV